MSNALRNIKRNQSERDGRSRTEFKSAARNRKGKVLDNSVVKHKWFRRVLLAIERGE